MLSTGNFLFSSLYFIWFILTLFFWISRYISGRWLPAKRTHFMLISFCVYEVDWRMGMSYMLYVYTMKKANLISIYKRFCLLILSRLNSIWKVNNSVYVENVILKYHVLRSAYRVFAHPSTYSVHCVFIRFRLIWFDLICFALFSLMTQFHLTLWFNEPGQIARTFAARRSSVRWRQNSD